MVRIQGWLSLELIACIVPKHTAHGDMGAYRRSDSDPTCNQGILYIYMTKIVMLVRPLPYCNSAIVILIRYKEPIRVIAQTHCHKALVPRKVDLPGLRRRRQRKIRRCVDSAISVGEDMYSRVNLGHHETEQIEDSLSNPCNDLSSEIRRVSRYRSRMYITETAQDPCLRVRGLECEYLPHLCSRHL